MKIGDYVKVNIREHYSHDSLGIISSILSSIGNSTDYKIDIVYKADIRYTHTFVILNTRRLLLANEQETIKINKLLTFI